MINNLMLIKERKKSKCPPMSTAAVYISISKYI